MLGHGREDNSQFFEFVHSVLVEEPFDVLVGQQLVEEDFVGLI